MRALRAFLRGGCLREETCDGVGECFRRLRVKKL